METESLRRTLGTLLQFEAPGGGQRAGVRPDGTVLSPALDLRAEGRAPRSPARGGGEPQARVGDAPTGGSFAEEQEYDYSG